MLWWDLCVYTISYFCQCFSDRFLQVRLLGWRINSYLILLIINNSIHRNLYFLECPTVSPTIKWQIFPNLTGKKWCLKSLNLHLSYAYPHIFKGNLHFIFYVLYLLFNFAFFGHPKLLFSVKDINVSFITSGFPVTGKFSPLWVYKGILLFSSSYLGLIFTTGSLIHSDFILAYTVRNWFDFFFHIVKKWCWDKYG